MENSIAQTWETMRQHQLIYIPGLGDPRSAERKLVMRIWRIYGISAHYFPFVWNDPQPFDRKLEILLSFIDNLVDAGNKVTLIGVSAGASAALNAFAHRKEKVQSVICICGKINNFDSVSADTFSHNPAFRESLAEAQTSIGKIDAKTRKRILSLHPLYDETVPIDDTFIEGADNKSFPCLGHALSIIYADTIGSIEIYKFIKLANSCFTQS